MTTREVLERVLRAAALLALALLLWRQWPTSGDAAANVAPAHVEWTGRLAIDSTGREASAALLPFILSEPASPLHLAMHAVPAAPVRGALDAVQGAGTRVTWSDSTRARGLAIDAAPTVDPDGRVLLAAAASAGAPLAISDAGGMLDSLTLAGTGTSLLVRHTSSPATARVGESRAIALPPAAVAGRRLLLYGRPGWESKFTIAALEESGWSVDASLPVSPRASVRVGAPAAADTVRYAAVIVLDTGLVRAATLARYVRDGGGLVVSGDGLLDRGLSGLLPARVGATRAEIPGGLLSPAPGSGLEALRLTASAGGVVLQRDFDAAPATVASRVGSGRVVAAAYRETWRWRMEGPADGVEAHRRWWTGLVRAAGYASTPADSVVSGESAPYADLVSRLDAPVPAPARVQQPAIRRSESPLDLLLLLGAVVALLAEWGSRRLRGAR